MKNILAFVLLLSFAHISSARSMISVTEKWGGDGITITAYSNGQTNVAFDCASGSITSFKIVNSVLKSKGTYNANTGMHLRPINLPRSEVALYSGAVNKKRMNLIIRIEGKEDREYMLIKGSDGNLRRCM